MTPSEKWIVESISKIEAKTDWLIERALESNEIDREADVRLERIEEWKTYFTGRWAVIGGTGFMVLTAIVAFAMDKLGALFTKNP